MKQTTTPAHPRPRVLAKKLKPFLSNPKLQTLKTLVIQEFQVRTRQLAKIQKLVKQSERCHRLQEIGAIGLMMDLLQIKISHYDFDKAVVLQAFLNLIDFESQRVLIQEVHNEN